MGFGADAVSSFRGLYRISSDALVACAAREALMVVDANYPGDTKASSLTRGGTRVTHIGLCVGADGSLIWFDADADTR